MYLSVPSTEPSFHSHAPECSHRQLFPSTCTFWLLTTARSGLLWVCILVAVGTHLFSPLKCQWFILWTTAVSGMLCLVLYCCEYTSAANSGRKLCCWGHKGLCRIRLGLFLLLAQFRVHTWRQLRKPIRRESVKAQGSESLGNRSLHFLSQAFWMPLLCWTGPWFAEVLHSVRDAREREPVQEGARGI